MESVTARPGAQASFPLRIKGLARFSLQRFSLRVMLAVGFGVVTIVPVLLLSIWSDRAALKREQDAVVEKHLLLAKNISGDLERYAQSLVSAFDLARHQSTLTGPLPGLSAHLAGLHIRCVLRVAPEDLSARRLVCPDGAFEPDNLAPVIAQRLPTGSAFTGVLPDVAGRPTFYIVAQETDGAATVAAVATDYIVQAQKAIHFGEAGHAAIVDRDGNVLAHPKESLALAIKNLSAVPPVAAMIAGETGIAAFYSPIKQAEMIAGHTVVPSTGWGVMVVQPLNELEARSGPERLVALIIIIAAITVSAFASWAFASYLSRAIQPILQAARANAAGKVGTETARLPFFAPADLHQLADSFNIMAREILSAYKRQEEALEATRKAEEVYRGIFESATEGIYRTAADGRLMRANPAMVALSGYKTEKEMLASVNDVAKEIYVDQGRRRAYLQQMQENGRVTDFVSEIYRHSTGEKIWISENARSVYDTAGELLYFEGTVVDVTERLRAEETLRRSEAQMRQAQRLASLCHWDRESRNPDDYQQMARILGTSADKIVAMTDQEFIARFVHPKDRVRVRQAYGRLRNGQGGYDIEYRIFRPDGRRRTLHELCEAGLENNGAAATRIATIQDVTERKAAEEAAKRAVAAESANRTKSEFLANLSHEFRTPLNAIIGFSEMMDTKTFGPLGAPRYEEYVKAIHESGLHLLNLIEDLLDLSKIEGKRYKLKEDTLDLARFLPEIVNLLTPDAQKKQIVIAQEIAADLPPLHADPRATKQMVLNLLSNAVKFTQEGGRITLQATCRKRAIHISIMDNGIGIPAEDLEKVLTPFGQVENPLSRSSMGTGLGLPIVRSLIRQHGGEFELESTQGEGTLVTLVFPASRSLRKAS